MNITMDLIVASDRARLESGAKRKDIRVFTKRAILDYAPVINYSVGGERLRRQQCAEVHCTIARILQ